MNNYITMDSFGDECPSNWEEIAAYLNNIISGMDDEDEWGYRTLEAQERIDALWEDYCAGDLPDAPKPIPMGMVLNAAGALVDYDAAVALMDDDLREELHADLAPCSDQDFFTAYEAAHEKRFGEPWALSAANPVY